MADREIQPPTAYAGAILLIETSEEMPSAGEVGHVLQAFGERGLLAQFEAVVVGRAYAARLSSADARDEYKANQRQAVLAALSAYAPHALAVFDVDFGHTDPQLIIPTGGQMRIDGLERRIWVTY